MTTLKGMGEHVLTLVNFEKAQISGWAYPGKLISASTFFPIFFIFTEQNSLLNSTGIYKEF